MSEGRPERAVVLVANAAAPYSRGLRVARTLADLGFAVEIAAVAAPSVPREEQDGDIVIRRYEPIGPWARWATGRTRSRGLRRVAELAVKGLVWPVHVRGWWLALRRDLPPADLYHACGILAIPVALQLGAAARRAGRAGRVVYDVIDLVLESNLYPGLRGPLLAWHRRRERRWATRADAIVAVNEAIAERVTERWRPARPVTVLLNGQEVRPLPAERPDLIRAATDLPPERSIVLFLGRLGPERGLDEAAEAVLRLPDAALAVIGFGPWADRLRARDGEPRFAGRHVTLAAVHPDEVQAWAASADVSIIAVPASSLNQRLSTPNKFWESLAGGTPVVVGRDLEVMRRIVETYDLGAVADPTDPADLARSLAGVLDRPPAATAELRERCARVSRETFAWEVVDRDYRRLVRSIVANMVGPQFRTGSNR
jgi:glycosyltransferase involved in cell wall biosynthesis